MEQDDNITAQENQDGAEDTTPNEYEMLGAMTPDERAEYNRAQFGDDVPLDTDGFVLEQGRTHSKRSLPNKSLSQTWSKVTLFRLRLNKR